MIVASSRSGLLRKVFGAVLALHTTVTFGQPIPRPENLTTCDEAVKVAAAVDGKIPLAEVALYESRAVDLCSQQKGRDDPDTLRSMNDLAVSYSALGRSAEALKLREETLALRRTKLGPDHPDTLASMNSLANSYSALGRTAEALKLREETLALRRTKLGPDHPNTLEIGRAHV